MKKRIFSLALSLIIIFSLSVPALAYEPTGFEINAKSAMLISLDTEKELYSKNKDQKMYPASITKIMTVILMLESEKYDPRRGKQSGNREEGNGAGGQGGGSPAEKRPGEGNPGAEK